MAPSSVHSMYTRGIWALSCVGGGKGAKSTRGRSWALVYAEKHRTRKGAMKREYALKHDRKFRALLRA